MLKWALIIISIIMLLMGISALLPDIGWASGFVSWARRAGWYAIFQLVIGIIGIVIIGIVIGFTGRTGSQ